MDVPIDSIKIAETENTPYIVEPMSFASKEAPEELIYGIIDTSTGEIIDDISFIIKNPFYQRVDDILVIRELMAENGIRVVPMSKFKFNELEYLLMPNLTRFGEVIIDKDFIFRIKGVHRFADINTPIDPNRLESMQSEILLLKMLNYNEIRNQAHEMCIKLNDLGIVVAKDDPFHILASKNRKPEVFQMDISQCRIVDRSRSFMITENLEYIDRMLDIIFKLREEVIKVLP